MLLNDTLSLSLSMVRSSFNFCEVMRAYICVVTMLVCPNTRLTLSIGIPFDKASVAQEWRPQCRLICFSIPQAEITFFNFLQIDQ